MGVNGSHTTSWVWMVASSPGGLIYFHAIEGKIADVV